MSDIFISYAREDRPRAEAIAKALDAHGWSVWWDWVIPTGKKFRRVIQEELDKARCVVVLWSANSIESDWVIEEASEGSDRGILLPVLVEKVRPPMGFRSMHAADLTNWEGDAMAPGFHMLCSGIDALIGAPKKVAGAAVAAPELPVPDPVPNQVTPAEPPDRFVRETKPAPARFGRRWAIAGASLAALVGGGYLVSTLPDRKSARTNRKDGLSYVWIEPGEFQMGDNEGRPDEKPRHRVRIIKGFWLGETPVTVAAYKRFLGERPDFKLPDAPGFNSGWSKLDHPIVRVTWDEAQAYCAWSGGTAGKLPTEAQWEYAARGGKDGLKYPWGNEITADNVNYDGSKWKGTSPVRSYPANAWGLYDMAGNVWEWTADWYDKDYYASLPSDKTVDDPRGPPSGKMRVLRGGSFLDVSWLLRAAFRLRFEPNFRNDDIGFRCVWEVVP